MPRAVASSDNLKLSARTSAVPGLLHDDLRKKDSHLPRPATSRGPLGETLNQSIRSRYGWDDKHLPPRSTSPVRDALRDAETATLDTTPPALNLDAPMYQDGDENPTGTKVDLERKERRRPRPSLSERTMETLSQMSPCPSPAPRTAFELSNDSAIALSIRPASRMKDSRPSTAMAARPESPSKRPFRPPGRTSPTKDVAALPPIAAAENIYTPPKAFVRGQRSRIAKPLHDSKRSISAVFENPTQEHGSLATGRTLAQTMRIKPAYGNQTAASHTLAKKASLSSIFRAPPATIKPAGQLAVAGSDSSPALLKPRLRGENSLAPSTPPRSSTKVPKRSSAIAQRQAMSAATESDANRTPKSSAVLRETIAKAKAARRKAAEMPQVGSAQSGDSSDCNFERLDERSVAGKDNKGLLRKRIQQAATSGQLNIAAMDLKAMPTEVMKMFDSENSTLNWSEVVDLIKLNAADNEIEELGDEIFPDYSLAELEDDEDKGNQFGGLESMDLHRNRLQHLPLGIRRLTRLHSLNLSGNKLTGVAFDVITQLPQLKELVISDNLISGTLSLGDVSLENLQSLDLQGNSIQGFDEDGLSKLKNLKKLSIANNKLSTFPWRSISALRLVELNISRNQISGYLIQGTSISRELRNLDASHNALEGISERGLDFPALCSLALDGNRLTALPDLTLCTQLQVLCVSENQLDEIPLHLSQLKCLNSADFGHNNIKQVYPEIARMESLSSLNLVGNPLRERKYLTMSTAELKLGLEKKLSASHIETVSSDGPIPNGGETVSQHRYRPSRGVLDLSSQSLAAINIEEIDLSDSDTSIHTLKLSNNDLPAFPTELLAHPALKYSLQSLDLSHNPLLHSTEYLSAELFLPKLKSLYIVSTGLTSLDGLTTYLKAPVLAELNISCHRLTGRVPWVRAWWPSCVTLLATDNWFSSIDVEGVRGLEVLDTRNNEIENLPPKIGLLGNFAGSQKSPGKLRVLEVSGNKFRVPRLAVVERGTEAVLKDLRRMINEDEVPEEWREAL